MFGIGDLKLFFCGCTSRDSRWQIVFSSRRCRRMSTNSTCCVFILTFFAVWTIVPICLFMEIHPYLRMFFSLCSCDFGGITTIILYCATRFHSIIKVFIRGNRAEKENRQEKVHPSCRSIAVQKWCWFTEWREVTSRTDNELWIIWWSWYLRKRSWWTLGQPRQCSSGERVNKKWKQSTID